MRKASIAVTALCAAMLAIPAFAQDKKMEKKSDAKAPVRVQKVILDNDKVRVTEGTFKPGEANPMELRGYRITRVLKGSTTMERTHKDGKVEKLDWKEGNVMQSGPDTSATKNVGKDTVSIYTVTLKQVPAPAAKK